MSEKDRERDDREPTMPERSKKPADNPEVARREFLKRLQTLR